jgi:hypothetical protein
MGKDVEENSAGLILGTPWKTDRERRLKNRTPNKEDSSFGNKGN